MAKVIVGSPDDPLAVLLASETMKSIAWRLFGHSMSIGLNKPSEYDNREVMIRDYSLAQKHGYVLMSVARALALDVEPLVRVLREDRLWEYPNEKADVQVFIAVARLSDRVSVEARVRCAESGLDPESALGEGLLEAKPHLDDNAGQTSAMPEAAPGQQPDGVYPPSNIVWRGQMHRCDLTAKQMDFMQVAIRETDLDIHRLMHPVSGILWKTRYVRNKSRRDMISKFLSRLNERLLTASPPLRIAFRLVRDRDYIVRADGEAVHVTLKPEAGATPPYDD